jgi:alkaline phosphatase D
MTLLHTPTGRRSFLLGAAIGVPALLTGGRALAATDPFTQGVASGDPWPDGFVIWTRIAPDITAADGLGGAPDNLPVRWEVAEDDRFRRIVQAGEAVSRHLMGGAVHVDLAGLRPDRPYWYRFNALGVNSPVGRAWTTPLPGAQVQAVRFTAATCSHYEQGWFSAYRHMAAEEESRFTLFLGDYIYEGAGRPAGEGRVRSYGDLPVADSLANYRRRYALHHADPDLQALHAAAPALVIWDDHETMNDYSGIWSQEGERLPPAAFAYRRANAYRAFVENMPLRLSRTWQGARTTIFRRMQWGKLAQFDLLDGRQYRSAPACTTGLDSARGHMTAPDCPDLEDPARTFLGFEQERWLYDGWQRSAARWNLTVQNLLVAPMVFDTPTGPVIWTDTWNGFGAARRRLLDTMVSSGIDNPVTLAGDYHSFWCNNLYRGFDANRFAVDGLNTGGEAPVAAEFVVSSVTSSGPPQEFYRRAMPNNPQITFFDSEHRGYMSFDMTADRLDARCMAISDKADPRATVRVLHQRSVEAGRPGLA